jgi:hypothetical protein
MFALLPGNTIIINLPRSHTLDLVDMKMTILANHNHLYVLNQAFKWSTSIANKSNYKTEQIARFVVRTLGYQSQSESFRQWCQDQTNCKKHSDWRIKTVLFRKLSRELSSTLQIWDTLERLFIILLISNNIPLWMRNVAITITVDYI